MKKTPSLGAAGNVSRETLASLEKYAAILKKWNRAINLVSASTVDQIWSRHILDSAQVFRIAPKHANLWVDMGSGAGFPGLVVACLAKAERPALEFVCIESDQRKAEFLRTIVRELDLNAKIIANRIEKVPPLGADIVSARALAPIPRLLDLAEPHLGPGGTAVFLKGAGFHQELDDAASEWSFDIEIEPSITESSGVILTLGGIRRA